MPQLNLSPWFLILLCTWYAIAVLIPRKLFRNLPVTIKTPKSAFELLTPGPGLWLH
uniref:ATP synthase complex subunit 8 n=1 Tax=Auriglobus modestus TaxID=862799 RepID=F2EMG8_AURMO|nr:ATP synthase F0 subunit 8 [Auriglobus modestus]BAK09786.1 ATPase subunit 8 [Auriglobus modestus]